jgi:hypothetical protein
MESEEEKEKEKAGAANGDDDNDEREAGARHFVHWRNQWLLVELSLPRPLVTQWFWA